ncbi:MAG TPA: sigma-70 family RNA polymerase sigma factor [Candidatus Limnocylindrales bacterium]|nr:sigma-70 family RNA polymerase sigma factor [Candidatus Limnocylindrales bacterium]
MNAASTARARAARRGSPPSTDADVSVVPSDAAMVGAAIRDEASLVARLRDGDRDAYETLVRSCGGRMLATARRMLGDEEEARNVVQDAFLSAYRSIGRFAGDSQLATWLHRIVINAALMRLRARRRRPEISIEELLPTFDGDGLHRDRFELPDDRSVDAGRELDRAALRQRVRDCIELLPQSYRTILMLRDIEEISTEEVAEMLGLTRENVKTRLHRARQALKALLEREGALQD